MNVTVNDKVTEWITGSTISGIKDTYNTKCGEAANDDLSTWRDVGKGIYDFRASGDYRVVAKKSGNNFNVAAIYEHASSGGKKKVCGETVSDY
jgi:hypothetical protein